MCYYINKLFLTINIATAGEKFDTSSVSYFLKKVKFPTEKWNDLAESLRLGGIVNTIEGDGGDNRKKLGRVVTHWCANDSDASWQKLVEAVSDCDELIKAKELAEKVGADPPEEGMHHSHLVLISINKTHDTASV